MSEERAQANRRGRPLFWVLLSTLIVLIPLFLYLGIVAARGSYAYYQFKIKGHAWVGEMWQYDPDLGYSHVPGFQGDQSFTSEVSIAVHIDEDGFRIPAVDHPKGTRPLVLTLGDSFTFGHGCRAEHTYPFLLAEALGGSTRNTGVSGHGIAQMLIRAEELVPSMKPDYLVVLHGGWLQHRSMRGFSGSRLAAIPTPYLVANGAEAVAAVRPAHEPLVFGMGLNRYWTTETGVVDYISFVVRAAMPLLIHNDLVRASLALQWRTGMLEGAVQDPERIAREVYRRLVELSRENGATLVVVSWAGKPVPMLDALPGAVIVYPGQRQKDRMPDATREERSRKYQHWFGSPPVFYDGHPNEYAHGLIVEDIMAGLEARGRAD